MTHKPLSRAVYIVAAKRTPFGTFGGALKDHSATDLAVIAAQATLEAAGASPELVDAVCIGNVLQTSADAIYLARHVGLRSGVCRSQASLRPTRRMTSTRRISSPSTVATAAPARHRCR